MKNLHIFAIGRICGDEILWKIAPLLQVPPLVSDDPDASFDAPATCSFFAHLFPTAEEALSTDDYEEYLLDQEREFPR